MAWQKYVSNHVPDWLHVLPLGLRASVWEILRFVIAGAVFGLLAGLVIGYAKDDTWNGKQKWAQEVQERKAEGQKLLDDVCRDFPNSGACKGR
ncbi:hypothetical protein CAD91_23530 [Salmonella enterica subsp. enterica serovar Oranienburg]|jgi:hypothetical protein|uniref:MobE n=1 Tax=Sterolibacterium denitrificans TaxID=157592 RepID=A0A7Z7HTZ7_9PROT|nr:MULTISPECIES: hypothetical protein [Pseudomonadota]ECS6733975.1 hypothetical protein [Salmonella enterica subsp. enterica serovar Oranienburg]EDU1435811.1 hypothetical protein [Salmonella enterica subsp. enterica serovar Othmarschen]EDI6099760.1 hypothetical protein [Salmonella enterica]EFU6041974.1 hypothetical protein [Escherichia coli]EFY7626027.1 hypothetical protein [Shigella sonnei]